MSDFDSYQVEDPLAGTPYRMIAPLGRGGMGEVVDARHSALDRLVVIKLLHPRFANQCELVDRMQAQQLQAEQLQAEQLQAADAAAGSTPSDFSSGWPSRTLCILPERPPARRADPGQLPAGEQPLPLPDPALLDGKEAECRKAYREADVF